MSFQPLRYNEDIWELSPFRSRGTRYSVQSGSHHVRPEGINFWQLRALSRGKSQSFQALTTGGTHCV